MKGVTYLLPDNTPLSGLISPLLVFVHQQHVQLYPKVSLGIIQKVLQNLAKLFNTTHGMTLSHAMSKRLGLIPTLF